MKTRSVLTSLTSIALSATFAVAARAETVNVRVVSVNPPAHTITTIEGRKPYVFTVTENTRFVDAKGSLLAVGLRINDTDVLASAVQKGYFKSGSRLSVIFAAQENRLTAAQVQFRDITRPKDAK